MQNILNRILVVCCGLVLIGCNGGGSSGSKTPVNQTVNISLSSGSDTANVPTAVSLTLNFNQAVNGVGANTVRVESPGSLTNVITESPVKSGNSYTFNLFGLTNATPYTVSLSNGITSVATVETIRANPFSFITVLPGIPTVQISQPINGSTGVALNSQVKLQFSDAVIDVSSKTLTWSSISGSVIPFTIESGPQNTYTLRLESGLFLNPNTLYNVRVRSGITSSANSKNPVPLTIFSFITATPAIPTVSLTSPNPTTNVSESPIITLTFSEAVSNVNTNTIQFQSQGGKPESIIIIESGNSYTLSLSKPLLSTPQYVVIVNRGISSVATGAQVAPTQFSFMIRKLGLLTSIGNVATGLLPFGITISPDGANGYVTNYGSNTVSQYNRSASGILTAIGTESPVATGNTPSGIIVSRDGVKAKIHNGKFC